MQKKSRARVSAVLTKIGMAMVCAISLNLAACNKPQSPATTSSDGAKQSPALSQPAASDDVFVGCYTVSHTEPAQIKIIKNGDSKNGESYAMQMREFNDPSKNWDKPEAMQVIATDSPDIQKYFDIKADEHQYLEKVIARPDRVFVLAKITDSFASLNPQFDSPYLGYIYKGSNTVYKVACEQTTKL